MVLSDALLESYVGCADVVGLQCQGVREAVGLSELPAEKMDFGGVRAPACLVEEVNRIGEELVFMVKQAVAKEPNRSVGRGEVLKELLRGHE